MKITLGSILGALSLIGMIAGAAMSFEHLRSQVEIIQKENAKLIDKVDELRTQSEEFGWWMAAIDSDYKLYKSRKSKGKQ